MVPQIKQEGSCLPQLQSTMSSLARRMKEHITVSSTADRMNLSHQLLTLSTGQKADMIKSGGRQRGHWMIGS